MSFILQNSIKKQQIKRWSQPCLGICLLLLIASCAGPQSASQAPQPQPSDTSTETTETVPVPPAPVPTAADPPAQSENTNGTATQADAIWTRLSQADEETYVVLFRHAIAPGTGDPANFQLEDCDTQRNLSEAGRQQARDIGEAFRSRNIPVVKVLSSQWCRCLETAELMDVGTVEPFPPLNSFFRNRSSETSQTDEVRDYILDNQDQPGAIVMVTHQVNVTALTDIFPSSGSAVILQPDSEGELAIVGQLLETDF